MKKLACMAMAGLVSMALMAPSATAGVGGAGPDRFGGSATKTTLQTELTIGGVAARSNQIPGVGGAEPEGVGGARPTGVGGARPLAFDAASRVRQLPPWVIEILLRGAWGR
jgi:hypothetical protein